MIKEVFAALALFALGSLMYGQDAAKITEILEAPQFTTGQAAYLVASWQDSENETLDYEQATQLAVERGLLQAGSDANDFVRLDELAGICMKVWDIPGGLFYRMTKANRYAFKELKALRYLSASDDPSFTVTGFRGLNIMYACMEYHTPALPAE